VSLERVDRQPVSRLLIVVVALLVATVTSAAAQGVRITGTTSLQAVDLRPLVEDSIPASLTTGTGPYRTTADGLVVRCVEGEPYCRFRRSGQREMVAPVVQDLRAVAWGFGEGVSLQTHVRARGSIGESSVRWPRADDAFDVIEAWLEIDRPQLRARLGRQWTTGGLGVFNYDGVSLVIRRGQARFEALGGRSLVVGLNEPATGPELGAINDLPPDEDGWLLGASASAPLGTRGAAAMAWQRVIRADRAGLYSDRLSANATGRIFGIDAETAIAWDITGREVNNAQLRLARLVRTGTTASIEARRHRPYFEAWTIWGAFSPVAFDELRATADWRNTAGSLGVDVRGARRRYDETQAGLESTPLRRDAWRAGIGAEWVRSSRWLVHADYDVDVGFGASQSDVVGGTRWMPDESRWIGVAGHLLQHIYEFRLGTGRVAGVRIDAGTRLTQSVQVVADAALYAHRLTNAATSPDWSQRRISLRVEWIAGGDPGQGAARRQGAR
jgi:hypothetical protein